MSRFERGFHPLPTVQSHETPRIDMQLNLPDYLAQDKIGVNVRRMHTMMRLGGINHVRISGASGKRSSFEPVVAASHDGVAFGALVGKEVVVATFTTESKKVPRHSLPFQGQWVDVDVKVNISEITKQIEYRKNKLRDTQLWSRLLNKAIADGLANAGSRHILRDIDALNRRVIGMTYGIGTSAGTVSFLEVGLPVYEGSLIGLVFSSIAGNIAAFATYNSDKDVDDPNGFRWSLINGPQLDRALLLQGLAKNTRVIKKIV